MSTTPPTTTKIPKKALSAEALAVEKSMLVKEFLKGVPNTTPTHAMWMAMYSSMMERVQTLYPAMPGPQKLDLVLGSFREVLNLYKTLADEEHSSATVETLDELTNSNQLLEAMAGVFKSLMNSNKQSLMAAATQAAMTGAKIITAPKAKGGFGCCSSPAEKPAVRSRPIRA